MDDASDSLIAIDTATGAGTAIGPLGMSGDFMDLIFDTTTGTLHGSETLFDRLVAIDGNTGQASVVATLEGAGGVFVPGTNPQPANVGSVYVFERDQGGPGAWGQAAKLLDVQVGTNELAWGHPSPSRATSSRPELRITRLVRVPLLGVSWFSSAMPAAPSSCQPSSTRPSPSGWGTPSPRSTAYFTAGTSASGCQALIGASGTASATASSGFSLLITGVEGQREGLSFCGTNGRQANPWGNGTSFVCVVPPRWRAGLLTGVGTVGACDGSFSQDLNAHWCSACPKPLHNPGAGAIAQAQFWYRDPQSTSNQPTSMSDAVEFPVVP